MLTLILVIISSITSFMFGRSVERIEWNKLIKDGTLPKPKKSE
jgi:hypothetical protein